MVCHSLSAFADAPRAGSAEAKDAILLWKFSRFAMHPVQAAPRQSSFCCSFPCPSRDAPRAGSVEAKTLLFFRMVAALDAPRAGSVKRNNNVPPDGSLTTGRHLFTFHPSRMRMVGAYFFVIMYNPAPIFLTNPAWRSRISPTVTVLSVTGPFPASASAPAAAGPQNAALRICEKRCSTS